MENILELQQVSKTFPKSNFTLENVTFSLPYGAILGFVGENGAGKTTTIGCILNTITKDSGTVKLFGQEMLDADTSLREKIGVVYDGDNFPSHCRFYSNCCCAGKFCCKSGNGSGCKRY